MLTISRLMCFQAVVAMIVGNHVGCSCSKENGSDNVSTGKASPGAKATRYQGSLDVANCDKVTGWVWDKDQPDTPLSVEIYDESKLVKTVLADQFRPGLLTNKKGNGKHQFTWRTPAKLKDGKRHEVHVRVGGAGFELTGSPKSFTCAGK